MTWKAKIVSSIITTKKQSGTSNVQRLQLMWPQLSKKLKTQHMLTRWTKSFICFGPKSFMHQISRILQRWQSQQVGHTKLLPLLTAKLILRQLLVNRPAINLHIALEVQNATYNFSMDAKEKYSNHLKNTKYRDVGVNFSFNAYVAQPITRHWKE